MNKPGQILKVYFGVSVTPLWSNILAMFLTVVYVQIILLMGNFMKEKGISADLSRKFIHIGAASWIICWPWFDDSHPTWMLNIFVPLIQSLKLFYKGAIKLDPNDTDVQTMSRTASPKELLYGPLQFCLFMCYLGLFKFRTVEGCILMAASGIGDGIAPLIGRMKGSHHFRLPFGGKKTLEGSIFGVCLGTFVAMCTFPMLCNVPPLQLTYMIKLAAYSTLFEAASPEGWDNIFLPFMMHLTLKYGQCTYDS